MKRLVWLLLALCLAAPLAACTSAPDSAHTVMCQRSGPHLTVQFRNVVGDHLGVHPEVVAQMVDQTYQPPS